MQQVGAPSPEYGWPIQSNMLARLISWIGGSWRRLKGRSWHTQKADVTNDGRAVNVKSLEDRVEDGVKRSLELRASQERADTVGVCGLALNNVGDGRGRDHGGSEGQNGENGELHCDWFEDMKSKRLESWFECCEEVERERGFVVCFLMDWWMMRVDFWEESRPSLYLWGH